MAITTKRDKLIAYLAGVGDKKVEALYTLLEDDINDTGVEPGFTAEQLTIMDKYKSEFIIKRNPGVGWKSMHQSILRNRKTG